MLRVYKPNEYLILNKNENLFLIVLSMRLSFKLYLPKGEKIKQKTRCKAEKK